MESIANEDQRQRTTLEPLQERLAVHEHDVASMSFERTTRIRASPFACRKLHNPETS
jgi:hypothetical protein